MISSFTCCWLINRTFLSTSTYGVDLSGMSYGIRSLAIRRIEHGCAIINNGRGWQIYHMSSPGDYGMSSSISGHIKGIIGSNRISYNWAGVRRRVCRKLTAISSRTPQHHFDTFGSSNPDAISAYRSGNACVDVNVELFETAITWYTKAIELDPLFTQAWVGRAIAEFKLRQFDQSCKDFSQALTVNGDDAIRYEALMGRAALHGARNDLARAVQDLSDALELRPNCVCALLKRSAVYLAQNDLEKALSDANKAEMIEPRSLAVSCQLGRVYSAEGNHGRAIRECSMAVATVPDQGFPEPFIARAAALLNDERASEALPDCDEAVRRNGGVNAFVQRGKVYKSLELWARAIADFTEALKLNPFDPDILTERACCYDKAGKHDLAVYGHVQALKIREDATGESRTEPFHLTNSTSDPFSERIPHSRNHNDLYI